MLHILVSDGKPQKYGIKTTCGTNGFVATNPGATVPNSRFCTKACVDTSNDDCDECKCAILVANEFNARDNFDTYTVSILDFKDGKFEAAKETMQVLQLPHTITKLIIYIIRYPPNKQLQIGVPCPNPNIILHPSTTLTLP